MAYTGTVWPQPGEMVAMNTSAAIDEAMRLLFARLSGLNGFSVIDAASMVGEREAGQLQGDLSLADITVSPDFDAANDDYFGDIAVVLIDLLEERPEARALLRGRTFARTLN
jgi:hypothetical protein